MFACGWVNAVETAHDKAVQLLCLALVMPGVGVASAYLRSVCCQYLWAVIWWCLHSAALVFSSHCYTHGARLTLTSESCLCQWEIGFPNVMCNLELLRISKSIEVSMATRIIINASLGRNNSNIYNRKAPRWEEWVQFVPSLGLTSSRGSRGTRCTPLQGEQASACLFTSVPPWSIPHVHREFSVGKCTHTGSCEGRVSVLSVSENDSWFETET